MIKKNLNNWQRKFIKTVFDSSKEKKKNFAKIVLQNSPILNAKNRYLPEYLFKYYSPSSENILDIKNQRLWLSHPKSFNDPFDCNIGYNSEKYEKKCLIDLIKEYGYVDENEKSYGFTLEDKNRILGSSIESLNNWFTQTESYSQAKYKILDEKREEFKRKVYRALIIRIKDLNNKIEKLRNINIRIACFSELDKYDEFHKQIAMWSHYADNHKGFCVEYDLSFLNKEKSFLFQDYQFYDQKKEYLEERNQLIIKAGIFPVEYTSKRVNIPITKLNQINFSSSDEITYNANIDELIYKTFIVKSTNWSYENEWRLIIDGKICEYYNNKFPFPYIKTIYLGCRAEKTLIDTMMDIGKEIGAEVTLLSMDGSKFKLEEHSSWSYKYDQETIKLNNPYDIK